MLKHFVTVESESVSEQYCFVMENFKDFLSWIQDPRTVSQSTFKQILRTTPLMSAHPAQHRPYVSLYNKDIIVIPFLKAYDP